MLAVHLWELAPDHAIFEELAFSGKAIDDLVSLGSWKSQKMYTLYKETRNNSICLQVCINKIEQSALVAVLTSGAPLLTLVLGITLIDGAHMVLAGPTSGQLRLLYLNSEVNEQFVL
jgi:hypothetical protein